MKHSAVFLDSFRRSVFVHVPITVILTLLRREVRQTLYDLFRSISKHQSESTFGRITTASLTHIESVILPNLQPENLVAEMKKALVDETDWNTLSNDGCRAFQIHGYVRGCILGIGAITRAPVSQSLYLQISIAQRFEKFFKTCPSLYREIVAPFFAAFWERTIVQSTGLFRTTLAYTQRQAQAVDGSAEGTRRLLSSMRFCLGFKLPEHAMEWLDASG